MRSRIENAFGAWTRWVQRRPRLAIALALFPTLVLAAGVARIAIDTSTEGFLDADDPARLTYERYREEFGRDSAIVIGLSAPDVFDLDFLTELREVHEALERGVPRLQRIESLVTARALQGDGDTLIVRSLSDHWPSNASELAGFRRLARDTPSARDLFIDADARVATLFLETDSYSSTLDADPMQGFTDREEAPRQLVTTEEDAEIVAALERVLAPYRDTRPIWVAGLPVLRTELQNSIRRDMIVFVSLSILVIAALLYAVFRDLVSVLAPLAIVVLSTAATLGLMGWQQVPIRIPTQILPSLLLAIGVCDAIHLLAIFAWRRDEGAASDEACEAAMRHAALPILLTSITTSGGLLAFTSSEITPARELGIYGAVGVMITFALTIAVLPGVLALRSARPRRATGTGRLERALEAIARLGAARPGWVVGLSGLVVFVSLTGLSQVSLSHDPLRWFPGDSPIRQSTEALDAAFRATTSIDVVVETPEAGGLHDPEILRGIDALEPWSRTQVVGTLPLGRTLSIAGLVGEIHQVLDPDGRGGERLPNERRLVAQELLLFESSGRDDLEQLADPSQRRARVRIGTPSADAVDYRPVIAALEAKVAQEFEGAARTEVTGVTVVMSRVADEVLRSLVKSYALAFAVIVPLMALLLGSLRLGLFSMLPNLLPIVASLGLMGWASIPLDTSTLLFGCIAAGLAVDDTIHFLHNFGRLRSRAVPTATALRDTMMSTGRALLATTIVLCGGFLVFVGATMENLVNLGLLVSFALAIAFLGDVLLVPALLRLLFKDTARTPPAD